MPLRGGLLAPESNDPVRPTAPTDACTEPTRIMRF